MSIAGVLIREAGIKDGLQQERVPPTDKRISLGGCPGPGCQGHPLGRGPRSFLENERRLNWRRPRGTVRDDQGTAWARRRCGSHSCDRGGTMSPPERDGGGV